MDETNPRGDNAELVGLTAFRRALPTIGGEDVSGGGRLSEVLSAAPILTAAAPPRGTDRETAGTTRAGATVEAPPVPITHYTTPTTYYAPGYVPELSKTTVPETRPQPLVRPGGVSATSSPIASGWASRPLAPAMPYTSGAVTNIPELQSSIHGGFTAPLVTAPEGVRDDSLLWLLAALIVGVALLR